MPALTPIQVEQQLQPLISRLAQTDSRKGGYYLPTINRLSQYGGTKSDYDGIIYSLNDDMGALDILYRQYPVEVIKERYVWLMGLLGGTRDKIVDLQGRGVIAKQWDTIVTYWNNRFDDVMKSDMVKDTLKKWKESVETVAKAEANLGKLNAADRANAEKAITAAKVIMAGVRAITFGYIDTQAQKQLGFIQIAAIPAGVLIAGCVVAVATLYVITRVLTKSLSVIANLPWWAIGIIGATLVSIFALPKILGKKKGTA